MRIDSRLKMAIVLMALAALLGFNRVLGVGAVLVLGLGLGLLWRPGLSPVFAAIFVYQWLQVSTKIAIANASGVSVEDVNPFSGDISLAIALSLAGLVCFALGIASGLGREVLAGGKAFSGREGERTPQFWLKWYLLASCVAFGAMYLAARMPGLSQPLLALASLKWAFFWMYTDAAFRRPQRNIWIWALAFTFELGLGLGHYFSTFKVALFFAAFGLLSSGIRLTPSRRIGLAVLGILTLCLAIVWTAVKNDQRSFLSGGEQAQVVTVGAIEGLSNFIELSGQLDVDALSDAAIGLAQRLSYVDFFGRVLTMVPEQIPHEWGALWRDAVSRPFMPRLFFPEKSVLDDSERTRYYTSLAVSGVEEGTSISLGYMAESYIDFGPWLMMVPIAALGWMLGRFYRGFMGLRCSNRLMLASLASVAVFQAAYFETSISKLFATLVVSMLASWMVARWLVPRFVVADRGTIRATVSMR